MPRDIVTPDDARRFRQTPRSGGLPALGLNHRRWSVPHAWGNAGHYWGYVKQIEAGHHVPSVDDLLLGMPPYRHDLLADLQRACDDARKLLDDVVIPEQADAHSPAVRFDLHQMATHVEADLLPAMSVYERDQAAMQIEQIGAAARSVAEGYFLSADDFSELEDTLRANSATLADVLLPTILRLRLLTLRIYGSSDFERCGTIHPDDINRLYKETEHRVFDMLDRAAEHKKAQGQPFMRDPYIEGLSWLASGVLYPIGPEARASNTQADAQASRSQGDGFAQNVTPPRPLLPTATDHDGRPRPAGERSRPANPAGSHP